MRGNNLPLRNADTSGISDEGTIAVASVGELKEEEFAAGREGDKSLDQGGCNRLGKDKRKSNAISLWKNRCMERSTKVTLRRPQ